MSDVVKWVLVWDHALFFWINNGWVNPFFDVVVGGATWLGNGGVLAAIVLPVLWVMDRPRFWQNTIILASAMALSGMASHLLKALVHRPRPLKDMADLIETHQVYIHVLWQPLRENSMPSGHAHTAFAIATSLGFLYRRWALLFLSVAILTGLSRVYVGAHYPSDVLVGAFIGISGAVVVNTVYDRWRRGRVSVLGLAPASPPPDSACPTMTSAEVAGAPGPTFELVILGGEAYSSDSLKGHPTLLVFWASWCPVCHKELPGLGRFYTKDKPAQLWMLSIGFADLRSKIEGYVKAHPDGFVFPTAYDIDNDVAHAFKITATPTIVLLDAQGRIVLVHRGAGVLQNPQFRDFLATMKG